MRFSIGYAVLFGLAGFFATAYYLKKGEDEKSIPVIGAVLCIGFSLFSYGFLYGLLTAIEYAVGCGAAHILIRKK
jgi:hypothetical protein